MRIKKISLLVLGIIFALAMVFNQLVNFLVASFFNLFPSIIIHLGGNLILTRTVGFVLLLLMGFLLGVFVALAYNLMAISKKFRLVIESD